MESSIYSLPFLLNDDSRQRVFSFQFPMSFRGWKTFEGTILTKVFN